MDLGKYTVVDLKEILRRLKLKCSGSRVELLARLAEVHEVEVEQACLKYEDSKADNNEGESLDNASTHGDVVGELQEMVEKLAAEVKMLRAANENAATCQNGVAPNATIAQSIGMSAMSTHQNVTNISGGLSSFTGQPFASNDALPRQHRVIYTSQPKVASSVQPFVSRNVSQPNNVYVPQLPMITTAQQYPTVWSMTPPQLSMNNMHNFPMYTGNQRRPTTRMPTNVYASAPNQFNQCQCSQRASHIL